MFPFHPKKNRGFDIVLAGLYLLILGTLMAFVLKFLTHQQRDLSYGLQSLQALQKELQREHLRYRDRAGGGRQIWQWKSHRTQQLKPLVLDFTTHSLGPSRPTFLQNAR